MHFALSDRDSQQAGMVDAARQAYFTYRERLWYQVQHGPDRYHPRRRSGETACTIASTADIADPQFVSTVGMVATLNTDLDAVSDENYRLRQQLSELQTRMLLLEERLGAPAPRSPSYRAESPPRKRPRYGSAAASTTVDDP